jgi:hypothetical protein
VFALVVAYPALMTELNFEYVATGVTLEVVNSDPVALVVEFVVKEEGCISTSVGALIVKFEPGIELIDLPIGIGIPNIEGKTAGAGTVAIEEFARMFVGNTLAVGFTIPGVAEELMVAIIVLTLSKGFE